MKTTEMHMLDQNLQKKSIFQYFRSPSNDKQNTTITDIEVEVPHVTTLTTKPIHKIDTVLHLETSNLLLILLKNAFFLLYHILLKI